MCSDWLAGAGGFRRSKPQLPEPALRGLQVSQGERSKVLLRDVKPAKRVREFH